MASTNNRIHKKMKKAGLTWVLSFLAVSFLCTGCTKSAETENEAGKEAVVPYSCVANADGEKKIYVILKNYHGDYWKSVIDGIMQAADQMDEAVYLGGIDNETDIDGQIALMDEAMEADADGILLAPANSNELVESCKKAEELNVHLALIDSSINSGDFDVCYMTDNMEAGETAAREMLTMLQEAGNVADDPLEVGILLSSDTSQAMVNRVSGFLDYWAKYAPEQWEVSRDILLNGGSVEQAQTDAQTLLQQHDTLKGIFGCNNTSTIGIANAIMQQERTDIVTVGFDMAEETKKLIKDPAYKSVTLLQKQDQMGYLGMLSLHDLINGQSTEQKYFDTGIVKVDADELMESSN